jgi:hypothetical protein
MVDGSGRMMRIPAGEASTRRGAADQPCSSTVGLDAGVIETGWAAGGVAPGLFGS